jgi:hypothetical protein
MFVVSVVSCQVEVSVTDLSLVQRSPTVARRCDQETSNEEAKARYGAVEYTTKKGCDAKKTNKQTNMFFSSSSLNC